MIHQRSGGKPVAEMEPEKAGHSSRPLQRRHVSVQITSVDALDRQRHVLPENLRDRPWYAHFGSGTTPILRDRLVLRP